MSGDQSYGFTRHPSASTFPMKANYYCYKNLVRVESPYGATNVIKGGDSGAPVCMANGAGKGLCALMVASNFFGGFAMFAESAETWWTKHGTFSL
jgi:hypothetical protein